MDTLPAFKLTPQYRDYIWGGDRLRPGQRTAEAWIIYEGDRIDGGPLDGLTLAQAADQYGAPLMGSAAPDHAGRFPLLVKLLDVAEWLSLQVHPNDQQAVDLEGPGHSGKTEAWHILQASPGAEILCGFRGGAGRADILQSVTAGTILDYANHLPLRSGETVFIPAGTLHALGPGLLVYEVQQSSDITYRVFDWNRPASAGRKLHIAQSLAVLDTEAAAEPIPPPPFVEGQVARLLACPYFTLDLITAAARPVALDPRGRSFHALTVIQGTADLRGQGWQLSLETFGSALVPASCGPYEVLPHGPARVLKAFVGE